MFQSVKGEVKIVPSLYKTKGLISDIALHPPGIYNVPFNKKYCLMLSVIYLDHTSTALVYSGINEVTEMNI
jgi:hypothetical protein